MTTTERSLTSEVHLSRWLVASLLCVAACGDVSAPSEARASSCADLEGLHASGSLRAGVPYTGTNGFTFELRDATAAPAALAQCRALEVSLDELVASGAPGATLSYETPSYQFLAARGLADVVGQRPMDGRGLFRRASLAKPYIGALAAALAVEGLLDLDNTAGDHALSDYLPEMAGRIQYAERITVRQLLTHTSGVPDYFGDDIGPAWLALVLDHYHRGLPTSEDDALALVDGHPAVFEPGTSAVYCNTDYLLAGRILSKVLGRPYQDELRARFLLPLSLGDTFWEKHDAFDLDRLAHGYRDATPLGESFSDWYAVDQGYGFANGGLVATARDIAAFFRAVPGGQHPVVGEKHARFLGMYRPETPGGYGLGLAERDQCYWHGGELGGYGSTAFHCVSTDTTGVVFVNSSEPEHEALMSALAQRLMARP